MTTSPVTGDGTQRRLWRPGLDPARIELRMSLSPVTVFCLAVGPAAIVWAVVSDRWWISLLQLLMGAALSVAGLLYGACWRSGDSKLRGTDFLSVGDFTALPPRSVAAVASIFDSVQFLHTNPAATWLDAGLLRDVHRAAWESLSLVDETRTARLTVQQARDYEDLAGGVRKLDTDLATIDTGLERVAECLRQTVVLATAWTVKADSIATTARLRDEVETAVVGPITPVVCAAESIPEAVFAYVTAARDVTGAGRFPWEHDRDEGAVSVLAAVLIPALLFVLALVVDGSGKMQAITRADAIAAEAARAAETALDTRGTTIAVDPNTAAAAARGYLRSAGYPGEVVVENARTVRVAVTVEQPAVLGLFVDSYRTTSTATAVLGVGTRPAGAFP